MPSFKNYYYNWILIPVVCKDEEIPFYSIKQMSQTLGVPPKYLYNHYYNFQKFHPILKHFHIKKLQHYSLF